MDTLTELFFGRERQLREIVQGVLAAQPASFSIVGAKYVGKTHLLRYLASDEGPLLNEELARWRPLRFQDETRIIVTLIDCDWLEARQNLLAHLADHLNRSIAEENIEIEKNAVDNEASSGRRVWQIARQLNQRGYRLVVVLDNFDRVFEDQLIQRDASDELRPLALELALVVATQQPLHDLDRELAASPLFNVMTQIFLGLVETDAARAWIDAYVEEYPGVASMSNLLLDLTGTHPFLLQRIDDIVAEVQHYLPSGQAINADHSELVRLRLAEHGRLLFTTQWRKVQTPPPRIPAQTVQMLLARMARGAIHASELQREQFATLNWLINQAVVSFGDQGYQLYSPLFTEYVATRLETVRAQQIEELSTLDTLPDLPIYQQLTKTEEALLRYFQRHSRRIVAPEQLLADVWRRPDASPRRVQEAIRRLRLQIDGADPPVGVIENERGRGYRFIPAA